ncbi:MAG: phosphoglycerate dehydrogenase [Synergistaceae bacterium]|jgi:D-3-phosphoglycerate dehydrogenase|nr:phosphoglycerate dehydrogenase [Synergistaceae bacterium]
MGGLNEMGDKKFRILVPESLGEEGLQILKEAHDVDADIKTGLAKQDLLKIIGHYDAIITRSGTSMDKAAIDAAKKLKVIARAGVGVDNVDIHEASRRGIVVINAPTGNTLAAAEQTMALMLAMVRHIPQAYVSLMHGEWNRSRFTGRQLHGKKILIIGLGRIGTQVGIRCRAFGMEVLGYDPYVPDKKVSELGFQKMTDLAGALSLADIVSIHVPITNETHCVINEKMLRAMKPGSYLINCARGGIVDEAACAQAIREGRLAGAAFDVFTQEPPTADNPLLADDVSDRIVVAPHLGATTTEAQTEVARIAVTNALRALRGEQYDYAVNLPFMEQNLNDTQKGFVRLARKMGILAAKLLENEGSPAHKCKVMLRGCELDDEDAPRNRNRPYTIAVIKGFLEVTHGPDTNYMVAPILAAERGISIEESFGESRSYHNLIEVSIEAQNATISLTGTITEEGRQRIVKVNDYWIDFNPNGQLLIFQNHDRPGVIGKIGKLLGDSSVNIANFSLGRKEASGLALAVMEVDGVISGDLLSDIERDGDMIWVTTAKLNGEPQK